MGFGVLIHNTIKGLTCLYEIMSSNLVEKFVRNKNDSCVASKCDYPIGIIYYVTSKIRKERSKVFMVDIKALIFAKTCSIYNEIQNNK